MQRERSAQDERRVIATLTAAGRALQKRAEHVPMELACAAGCPLDELAELTARLQTLRRNVARHVASVDH